MTKVTTFNLYQTKYTEPRNPKKMRHLPLINPICPFQLLNPVTLVESMEAYGKSKLCFLLLATVYLMNLRSLMESLFLGELLLISKNLRQLTITREFLHLIT